MPAMVYTAQYQDIPPYPPEIYCMCMQCTRSAKALPYTLVASFHMPQEKAADTASVLGTDSRLTQQGEGGSSRAGGSGRTGFKLVRVAFIGGAACRCSTTC